MAGIAFHARHAMTLAQNTEYYACQLYPNNNERIMIREISATFSDPNSNGGYCLVTWAKGSTAGTSMTSKVIAKDNEAIPESILASFDVYNVGQGNPVKVSNGELQRKRINVQGGEYIWTAIRETDKLPLSGNGTGDTPEYFLLILQTDTVADAVECDFFIRGEI